MFDQSSYDREFKEGDLVLLWDKRSEKSGNHKKFQSLWLGPYQIKNNIDRNYFILEEIDDNELPLLVNKQHIK